MLCVRPTDETDGLAVIAPGGISTAAGSSTRAHLLATPSARRDNTKRAMHRCTAFRSSRYLHQNGMLLSSPASESASPFSARSSRTSRVASTSTLACAVPP